MPSSAPVLSLAPARWIPLAIALLLVAGCGGGGDAGGGVGAADAVDAAVSAPPDAPAQSTAASVAAEPASPDTTATCGLADFQARLLERVNAYRAAGATCGAEGPFPAAGPLAWHDTLKNAATGHAQDMAANDYVSHTSLDGRTIGDRVTAAGYLWRNVGENLAAGYATVDAVVDAWMGSDGHCANLMNPAFVDVGTACVAAAGTTYGTYWAMNLGRPR